MAIGDYTKAGLVYENIFWKSDQPEIQSKARLGRARALKELKNYPKASQLLSSINLFSTPEQLRQEIIYEQVLIKYLEGDYPGAVSRGMFGESFFKNSNNDLNVAFYLLMALSAYQSNNPEKGYTYSLEYFSVIDPDGNRELLKKFQILLDREEPKQRNTKTASILSMILPGSGIIYSGDTKKGLINLGLNAIGVGGAVFAVVSGYYVTAWLVAAFIVQRLYFAGIDKSSGLANKKNRLENNIYLQPILEFLLTCYPST